MSRYLAMNTREKEQTRATRTLQNTKLRNVQRTTEGMDVVQDVYILSNLKNSGIGQTLKVPIVKTGYKMQVNKSRLLYDRFNQVGRKQKKRKNKINPVDVE